MKIEYCIGEENMIEKEPFENTLSVAPLKVAALESCTELAEKVDKHLVEFRKSRELGNAAAVHFMGYVENSYLLQTSCPRFGTGEAKGVIKESVRGVDLFIMVDITNYSLTYSVCGYENHMSPDNHYQDLKRIIAASVAVAHRVTVIMPFLYESRQHKRTQRESLDCALALQELIAMGVSNIITFDAHDPRVANAIPLYGFDSFNPSYQFIKTILETEKDLKMDSDHMMIISPDEGAMNRAVYFANVIGVDMGMFYKRRDYSVIVDGKNPIVAHEFLGNEVEGKDVIIIDEMSMVDINLIHALLKAVLVGTRLILVGDVNQLPSVGPGNVLKDMINAQCFQVVRLSKIFRQASQSDIIVNAHKINRGERVSLENKSKDFLFLKRDNADVIISVIITLIQKKLPHYVNAKELELQVLTPMRKGLLGVERLNNILQEYLNPPSPSKKEKEVPSGLFREGDKVMQTKNNYQMEWEWKGLNGIILEKGMGVFNGDTGIICEINEFAETMCVEFDENKFVTYTFKQLEELELAYAITIHKSQGSEYPAVIVPLLTGPQMLMNRNLLYTAITRARKCVCLVGSPDTFYSMVDNQKEQLRYSGLKECICELISEEREDQ